MLNEIFVHTKSISLSLHMQRIILILVVYFSFLDVVLSQEKEFFVQVIIDDEEEEHPGSVYLFNPRTKSGKFIDSFGRVQLMAQENDVLYVESDFYENRTILITPNLFEKGKINLHLAILTIELDEVKIRQFTLTGDLVRDAKNVKFRNTIGQVYANLGIREKDVPPPNPSGQKVDKFRVTDVLTLKIPKIIGELNGYNKRQRELFAYEKHQDNIQIIRDHWTEEYFVEYLKIPSFKIQEFLSFAYESSDILAKVENNHMMEAETILESFATNYLERLNNSSRINEY